MADEQPLSQRVRDYVAGRMTDVTVNGEKQQVGFVHASVVLRIADRIEELEKKIHDRATCPDCGETFTTTPFAVMEEERDAARSKALAMHDAQYDYDEHGAPATEQFRDYCERVRREARKPSRDDVRELAARLAVDGWLRGDPLDPPRCLRVVGDTHLWAKETTVYDDGGYGMDRTVAAATDYPALATALGLDWEGV